MSQIGDGQMFHSSTWALVLSISLIAIVKTIIASPPSFVVDWYISKIDTLHPNLSEEAVTVSHDGVCLEGDDKRQVVTYFNQAVFLKKYDVLPIKPNESSIIIEGVKGNKPVRLSLYIKNDRVDVFKYSKKKVVAYYLSVENAPRFLDKTRSLASM